MMSSRYSSLASRDNSLAILICLSTFASHFLATAFLALSAEKGFILWYSHSKTSSTCMLWDAIFTVYVVYAFGYRFLRIFRGWAALRNDGVQVLQEASSTVRDGVLLKIKQIGSLESRNRDNECVVSVYVGYRAVLSQTVGLVYTRVDWSWY